MFTAMIMICLIDNSISSSNCIILSNQTILESERECEDAIASLVSNEYFQTAYVGYEPKKYSCYHWDAAGADL
jgi:hypothetical protein